MVVNLPLMALSGIWYPTRLQSGAREIKEIKETKTNKTKHTKPFLRRNTRRAFF